MNKKILSIFALIMAISILGVSCAENPNNPNNNGGSTPPISAEDAKKVVNAITDDIGSTAFKFSTADVTANGTDYVVTLDENTTATEVNSDTFLAAIQAKATDMQNASTGTKITIAESDIKMSVDQQNNKKATVTITYKVTDGGKTGNIIINLELKNSSASFTYPKLVLTPTKGTTDNAFGVNLASETLTIDLADAISETGVTYEVTAVAGVNKTTITPNTTVDLSSGATVTETQKTANYTVKDTVITIDAKVKTELIGSKARAAGALGTADATGGIKITLTAKKTGYTDKTDLEIYVVLTGYEAE